MKINKLNPQGYCNGVKRALALIDDVINNPDTIKPIYMLGAIIHNKNVINYYKNKNIIILEDKFNDKLELVKNINSGTIIISAHGASPTVFDLCKKKGLNIIDTTCPNVLLVHNRITKYLDLGYEIIYIGKANHPEAVGVLGISNNIHFICNLDDCDNLKISNEKIYITNQTTLSKYDILDIFDSLKNKFPNAIIDDKLCNSTTIRQDAIINQPYADLCIVVGDKSSSNTKSLLMVSQKYTNIFTILCEGINDLDIDEIKKCNIINITSGASTPSYIVDKIIEYIKK